MSIEKHMLQTHSLFEKAGEVLEGVAKLKERIAELEKENESLKYSVAALETDLAMSQRWRKCSEEMPQNYDDGDEFLIAVEHESTTCPKGYYVTIAELVGGEWSDDEGRDIDEDIEYDLEDSVFCSQAPQGTKKGFYHSKVTHWMPLPSAPMEDEGTNNSTAQ